MILKEPVKQTDKIYVGVVVDNNDPSEMQRVRVRLPQHPIKLKDSDLPWSVPEKTGLFGSGSGTGSLSIPVVGSFVLVRLCPDQYSTVYTQLQTNTSQSITEGYPDAYGLKDPNGNYITMNMAQNLLKMLLHSDVQISQSGDIKIKLAGNVHLVCDGLYMQANDINITSKNISTNSCISAATIDAYDVTANNLSAMSAKLKGIFEGTLKGGSTYSSIVTMAPGDYPSPACDAPEVLTPAAPDIDF